MNKMQVIEEFALNKLEFIQKSNYKKATKRLFWGMYTRYLYDLEMKNGIDLFYFSKYHKRDFYSYISHKSKSTISTYNSLINSYNKWYSKKHNKPQQQMFCLDSNCIDKSWYISKTQLFDLCEKMLKHTSIFNILPIIFARYGIVGKQACYMRNLKFENINYNEKIIVLQLENNQKIIKISIDDEFLKWIRLAEKNKKIKKNKYIITSSDNENIPINYSSLNSKIYRGFKETGEKRISLNVLDDCSKIDYLYSKFKKTHITVEEVQKALSLFYLNPDEFSYGKWRRLKLLYYDFVGFENLRRKYYKDNSSVNIINHKNKIDLLVDEEDIPKIKKYKWYINSKNIICSKYKYKSRIVTIFLPNLLLNKNNKCKIQYKNENVFDNRKSNLLIINN